MTLRELWHQWCDPSGLAPNLDIDALLREHPDLPARAGEWWANGMASTRFDRALARILVDRGAALTVHAAAGLGFTEELARLLEANPVLVHARGGDGCTPLHFARDIATAELLLARGAALDDRDGDHNSTPAQWRIGDGPEVARFLIERGAQADLFLAAALGDRELAAQLIAANPGCTAWRIGRPPEYPGLGHDPFHPGGSVFQWSLAFNSYAHQIALRKGHPELFEFLYEHSDPRTRLLVNCVLARRDQALEIAAADPGLVRGMPGADLELLPRYCWETNTNLEAVRLMLDLGFPVAHLDTSHGYSALHNAAWSGHAGLTELLISRGAPVDLVDPKYAATPLEYALHDLVVAKRHPEGEFARVVESLLEAGSPFNRERYPTGDAAVDAVLARYL